MLQAPCSNVMADDFPNTREGATLIETGFKRNGRIFSKINGKITSKSIDEIDQDYFKIELIQGAEYEIKLQSRGPKGLQRGYIRYYAVNTSRNTSKFYLPLNTISSSTDDGVVIAKDITQTQIADIQVAPLSSGYISTFEPENGEYKLSISQLTDGSEKPTAINYGTDKKDKLKGSRFQEKIYGLDGNDVIKGMSSDDHLYGNLGFDSLNGGNGNDSCYGGNGHDFLAGAKGNDKLHGGNGNDEIIGGYGKDTLIGGSGKDVLIGGPGKDSFALEKGKGFATIKDYDPRQDKLFFAEKPLKLRSRLKDNKHYIYGNSDLLAVILPNSEGVLPLIQMPPL